MCYSQFCTFILMVNYKLQLAQNVIEAETQWAMFVSKNNLAFLTRDHATKVFANMFPDSEIAMAIIKEALAPHFLQKKKTKQNMASHFSIMMDESKDKRDKSCEYLTRGSYQISRYANSQYWYSAKSF